MQNPTVAITDLEDLYFQLLDAFYEQGDDKKSQEIARRFDQEFAARPDFAGSIRGDEVRSLVAELRGDLAAAIRSRQTEIRKILELHSFAQGTRDWNYVFRRYNYEDIRDRLDILATLHEQSGDDREALQVLNESKAFCSLHNIVFDGEDMTEEYMRAVS